MGLLWPDRGLLCMALCFLVGAAVSQAGNLGVRSGYFRVECNLFYVGGKQFQTIFTLKTRQNIINAKSGRDLQ